MSGAGSLWGFSAAQLVGFAIGVGLNLYVVLGGADFGGGVWDLVSTGRHGARQRELIEQAIGPIWEANHVWIILVVVLLFTAFPPAFGAYMVSLHVPITLGLVGIVLRGSSFAFRSYGARGSEEQRRWGRVFAVASTITPVVLGMSVGSIASGRAVLRGGVPVRGFLGSWLAPFPLLVGLTTLSAFSFLAAVYLSAEAHEEDLATDFRRRALVTSVTTFAIAGVALLVSRDTAPRVWHTLVHGRFAPVFHVAALGSAIGAFVSLLRRRYLAARWLAVSEVSFILWGWLAAQYPYLLYPDLTLSGAAAPDPVLRPLLLALAGGGLLLFPSFFYLFRTFGKLGSG